jgi:hypothetical protein
MNKTGQELGNQLLGFGFIFVIFVIFAGITGGIYLFFGGEYDYRQVEANSLNYKIYDCLLDNFDKTGFVNEFYDLCEINKEVLEDANINFKICVNSENCITDDKALIYQGSNFQECSFEGYYSKGQFMKCANNTFNFRDTKIDIITGSNQKIRRIA